MIKRRSKDASANACMVSPNRIAAPGSFSAAHSSVNFTEKKTVTSFQLRNQMFDQELKDDLTMSKMIQRKNEAVPVVEAPKQGLTLTALKRHNQEGRTARNERRSSGSEEPSTSRSSRSESSRKKSAYELEVILVEKQLQLKKLKAEQDKKKKLYGTVARQLVVKRMENIKAEQFIAESLEASRINLQKMNLL